MEMRQVRVERYGPPDSVVVVDAPVPRPGRGEVVVRVEAAGVNSGDARMRAGRFPPGFGLLARLAIGLRGPRARVLGGTFSGVVAQVGDGVHEFGLGDEVAGMTGVRMGCHAEFVVVPAVTAVRKPALLSHPDAAGVLFGGTAALHFLRDRAAMQPGATVLVNGASGSVGSAAVQIATILGGTVTAVCSAANRDLARRLGAQRCIDYTTTPVAEIGERFDVVFDAVGNLSRADGLRLRAPGGALVLAVAGLLDTIRGGRGVYAGPASEQVENVAELLGWAADQRLDPVVTVVGQLSALPEAYRRIDGGRKVGNLVVLPA
ncbi:NAD(P)-dependent alcohol dehydrogenase [Micropruina sp.]|uniref:NAD(P)-dependent alcohol dehydrogenase n=1 Tax=Micropruina sp. TaxID=2737536 RepID=UPI002625C18A|nr:NAD(P)-dependent alcohol dehydrogenase [Micropruina sp.]